MIFITLSNDAWQMTIDLSYVCEHAGKRDRWYDERGKAHSYIPFTLVHARKIFQLIKEYAEIDAIFKVGDYISEFADKKVIEQWEKA